MKSLLVSPKLCKRGFAQLGGVLAMRFSSLFSSATDHPLDALSKEKVTTAIKVLQLNHKICPERRFPVVARREPSKDEVLPFQPGRSFQRTTFVVVYERHSNETLETTIDCTNAALVSWKKIPGVQPCFTLEEIDFTQEIVQAGPQWQAAMHSWKIINRNSKNTLASRQAFLIETRHSMCRQLTSDGWHQGRRSLGAGEECQLKSC